MTREKWCTTDALTELSGQDRQPRVKWVWTPNTQHLVTLTLSRPVGSTPGVVLDRSHHQEPESSEPRLLGTQNKNGRMSFDGGPVPSRGIVSRVDSSAHYNQRIVTRETGPHSGRVITGKSRTPHGGSSSARPAPARPDGSPVRRDVTLIDPA